MINKKVLKRRFDEYIKTPIYNHFRRPNQRWASTYAKYYDKLPIKKNTILYECRDGKSISDNPYAIFKYLLNNPEFKDYTHIWTIRDYDTLKPVISQYEKLPNVKFVKRNTRSYFKYLASCEYLINNSTFQTFYTPKKGQIYINTWHGTPLKHMGFDIPGNPANSQNVLRNFLCADYILSPNPHTTNVYKKSYKLEGLYEGLIIEEGYPRIDLTFHTNREEFTNYLESLGVKIDKSKKNILYAPTWKGTDVNKANDDVAQIIADIHDLENDLGDQYNFLIKVHPFIYNTALNYPEIKGKLVPDFIDANELLAIVDILITDYSSIFFDFLVTSRPIIFYTWDAEVYREERGQYIENKDLPGPIVYNCRELKEAIANIDTLQNEFKNKYEKMQEQFTKYDDGNVTNRIVKGIFQDSLENLNTVSCKNPNKEKILIYPGGLRDNGITSSFLNLMHNIDHEKFDITCFVNRSNQKAVLRNMNLVNKNVRFIFKPGAPVYKLREILQNRYIHNRGERGFLGKKLYPEKAYQREQLRLFGKTHFDYAIDFSGYSFYWAKFLLATDAKKKICFLHSDMLSDCERTVNGRRPHWVNLRGLFSVYHRFDKLVSVSKGTMELNQKKLREYASPDKFDYVLNTINVEKILRSENENNIKVEETNSNSVKSTEFKSHAILKNIQDYPVWNTLPGFLNAKTTRLSKEYENAKILIVRKADIDEENTLYKFMFRNQVIGWIDSHAVELTDDEILNEENVNKIAKVLNKRGYTIWAKPYNLPGNKRVSKCIPYIGLVVDIDKQVKTIHGTYSRIIIDGTVIGWLDNRALKIYEFCTINDHLSSFEKTKREILRKLIFVKNNRKFKELIKNIENRTLEEILPDKKVFAEIANPGEEIIWSKAYPNYQAKKKAFAREYSGKIAEIKKAHRTKNGLYYEFSINGEIQGWLEEDVFKIIEKPVVIKEKDVLISSVIKNTVGFTIWSKPPVYDDAQEKDAYQENLSGQNVTIVKELETTIGVFCKILLDGKELGWVEKEYLEIQEILGKQINGKFIPYPDENEINFVTMGRLSPEKGQDNLIRAFAKFHKKHPNSKLYILGEGPLKQNLQNLIYELNMDHAIFLMGQMNDPFPFLKKCDCFVLSSHYEGQSMVLLEAMTLGMKIIATDIIANRTVLEDGKYGLLVENSVEGLEGGLHYIVENPDYRPEKFDYKNYNKKAIESFIKVLHE